MKLQAVLSNATKKSSTLRKAVFPEGLKVTRPVGRIDPNLGVSPLARAHNRDRSPPQKKSHSGWSCPGSSRKTAKNGDYKSRGIGKSPSQFYLTETKRRNESSIFHQGHLLCH